MSTVPARREIDLEDLSGLAATKAVERLRAVELRPAVEPTDVEDSARHGQVIDQIPGPHSAVRRGQLVTLLIGQATASRQPPSTGPARDGAVPVAARSRSIAAGEDAPIVPSVPPPGPPVVEEDVPSHGVQPAKAPVAETPTSATAAPGARVAHPARRRVGTALRLSATVIAAAVAVAVAVGLGQSGAPAVPHPPTQPARQSPNKTTPIIPTRPSAVARRRAGERSKPSAPQHHAHHISQRAGARQVAARVAPQMEIAEPAQPAAHTPTAAGSRPSGAVAATPPSPTGPLPGPYPNEP